jgi:hypothetical protein
MKAAPRGAQLSLEEKPPLVIPPGYTLVKTGGRPKKEARDAAVFLAKLWRMDVHEDSASMAEKWIVENWELAGKEASKGISETAHVRASIKRSRKRGLDTSFLSIGQKMCMAVECKRTVKGFDMGDGARMWMWAAGMTEAAEGKMGNLMVYSAPQMP